MDEERLTRTEPYSAKGMAIGHGTVKNELEGMRECAGHGFDSAKFGATERRRATTTRTPHHNQHPPQPSKCFNNLRRITQLTDAGMMLASSRR